MIDTTPISGKVPMVVPPSRKRVPLESAKVSGAAKARALVLAGKATEISPRLFHKH